jgi:hypothetical protein
MYPVVSAGNKGSVTRYSYIPNLSRDGRGAHHNRLDRIEDIQDMKTTSSIGEVYIVIV